MIRRDYRQWDEIIRQWEQSGKSQKQFCDEQQLSYRTFLNQRSHRDHQAKSDGEQDSIQAVALHLSCHSDIPESSLEIAIERLTIPIDEGKAVITVKGKLTLAQLGKIFTACTVAHQGANDASIG